MSRVDAVRIAVDKARELGHSLEGAVLASDAFFPFADGPQLALDAGIRAIIQPGGSKRDDEVDRRRPRGRRDDGAHGAAALPALNPSVRQAGFGRSRIPRLDPSPAARADP